MLGIADQVISPSAEVVVPGRLFSVATEMIWRGLCLLLNIVYVNETWSENERWSNLESYPPKGGVQMKWPPDIC